MPTLNSLDSVRPGLLTMSPWTRWVTLCVLTACLTATHVGQARASDANDRAPQFLVDPKFELSPFVPLAGTLTFESDRLCTALVELVRDGHRENVPTREEPSRKHDIDVLGLRCGQEHRLVVRLQAGGVISDAEMVSFTTSSWPSDFPTIRVTQSDPTRVEPGITLFSLFRWKDDRGDRDFGALIAVDAAGEVVWYYRADSAAAAVKPLNNGNLLFIHGAVPRHIREMDRLGRPVREFQATALGGALLEGAIPVDVDTFHHDLFPMPSGHLTALTTEVRLLDRFPLDLARPTRSFGPAQVIGDVVIELDPTGSVVKRWPLHDILDPRRISYSSHDNFWQSRGYGDIPGGTKDWTHANAVIRDPSDGGIIVSLRHQDAVVKIDAGTSEVKWILGTRAGWRSPLRDKVLKPTERTVWQFHQHGVKFTPHGTLLMFDNGNFRAIPPARKVPPTAAYSRAVEYEIDEAAMTATQVWTYGGPGSGDRFYSPYLGDADWLPQTGNVLITDGAHVTDSRGRQVDEPPGDKQWARIIEVTHGRPSRIVWELTIDDRSSRPSFGWSVYRAERLPGLSPATSDARTGRQ
jgi:hypothetical protein